MDLLWRSSRPLNKLAALVQSEDETPSLSASSPSIVPLNTNKLLLQHAVCFKKRDSDATYLRLYHDGIRQHCVVESFPRACMPHQTCACILACILLLTWYACILACILLLTWHACMPHQTCSSEPTLPHTRQLGGASHSQHLIVQQECRRSKNRAPVHWRWKGVRT